MDPYDMMKLTCVQPLEIWPYCIGYIGQPPPGFWAARSEFLNVSNDAVLCANASFSVLSVFLVVLCIACCAAAFSEGST